MINIALTGLNGYGKNFLESLLKENEECRLAAVISRNPKACSYYEELLAHGVRVFSSLEECLEEVEINLVMITTPMHIHYKEIMTAIQYGANVYCEKPLAPTIDECIQIEEQAKKKGVIVAVGFQWSYSKGIRDLKSDILSGKYGRLKSGKAFACLNRPKSYFEGSEWKGKSRLESGQCVLESVMSNGAAHFLHNLFFLAGDRMDVSAYPKELEGECYRAHKVEGYDTIAVRIKTTEDAELSYYATIVSEEQKTPMFELELENAIVRYPAGEPSYIEAETKDGEKIRYQSPEEGRYTHYREVVKAIKEKKNVICSASTAIPHVMAVNAVAQNIPVIEFEKEYVTETDSHVYVKEINHILRTCYENRCLPYEMKAPFSKQKYRAEIKEYKHFTGLYQL